MTVDLPFLLHFAEAAPDPVRPPARPADPVDLRDLVARLAPTLAGRLDAQPAVLLLAYPRNPDAVRLERALLARGVPGVLLGADDFPAGVGLSWQAGGASITCSGRRFDVETLRGVWFALPDQGAPAATECPLSQFAAREWADALAGWWRDAPVPFVNPPAANLVAGNKITGLRAAARAGLAVPDTLVTNDPDRSAAFLDTHHGRVVAKSLHSHYVELDGRRHSLFTRRITPDDRTKLAAIVAAPCILQPELVKRSEIRATVVGDRVLTAEFDTADLPEADAVDVRRVMRRVPVRAHELPDEVGKRCIGLVAELGLRYAALDLVRTPDDEYVFLDLNPRGGWWFVEERTGLPISDTVAGLLAGTP